MKDSFKSKLVRFMYGRYGIDELYYALFILYIVLLVINIAVSNSVAKLVISILMWLTIIFLIFRVMSKNHIRRRNELNTYLRITGPIKMFFTLNFKRIRDIRSKRYRVCKNCKAVVRLPIKKGTHGVICPKCKNKFNVTIRF